MPGSIIAAQVFGMVAGTFAYAATAFAINMVASAIISKAFGAQAPNSNDSTPNPGNNQQLPPAGDNKLPVVYGTAFVGGIITDLSITNNNQKIYYVLALSEVTNTETVGATPDTITFGNVYWGGKKCVFATQNFSYMGEVIAVDGDSVLLTTWTSQPQPGQLITFSNTGNPVTYTVQSSDAFEGIYSVQFTSPVVNVNSGDDAYFFTPASSVIGLLDESTGVTDTTVLGKLNIYLYSNGSNSGVNTTRTAIEVMQSPGLVYAWDSTKLMSNCAFAIVEITYSQSANLTGIQQTRFQITNSRSKPGDCFYDYLMSKRYGAALTSSQIDETSLNALNDYSDEPMTYTTYTDGTLTQTRFRFDGMLDTNNTIMTNMQSMSACCDCLIKFNEITGQWGVIVQSPTYTIAMDINDSNMVSAIQITPIDLASSYNIAEVKFPDGTSKDTFNSATFDLAVINPTLLYPNEPVNKQTINLPLVNNSVRAQYLANRFLEGAREDLQVKVDVNFSGIQLEAGDIVTVTNANYGWVAKQFRISQVIETFTDDGQIIASLTLMEFNSAVYDDVNVTQFTPAPNTGIGSPLGFGTLYAPTITNQQSSAPVPSFDVAVTAASDGIVQYAEVYYSAYSSPTDSQRIFAGITAVNPGGNPYDPNSSMGVVTLTNIPQGDWYFAVKYFNALGASNFSASSSVLQWRPLTFQYSKRWLAIAYADNATGTSGFSYIARNKSYYGLYNNDTANGGTDPTLYTWYQAPSTTNTPNNFGTADYLLYANRSNRKFSFNVGNAGYQNLGGAFVPTNGSIYDSTVWSGLPDPTGGVQSFIDLDARTGQLVNAGYSGTNQNDGFLDVTNQTDGSMKVQLKNFLGDLFGTGIYTKTFNAATLTIDVYGRVVGFTEQDQFFYTETVFTATAGQTTFNFTHTSISGQILVFRNGVLLISGTDYTETSTTVVMSTACAVNDKVVCIYMYGISTSDAYVPTGMTVASIDSVNRYVYYNNVPYNTVAVGDIFTVSNVTTPSAPTQYTVQSGTDVNIGRLKLSSVAGISVGDTIYRYRAAGSTYFAFTGFLSYVTSVSSFQPLGYGINNGFEQIYINGAQITEVDYNVVNNQIQDFPGNVTGAIYAINYAPNNLGVPCSNVVNNVIYSVATQLTYAFPNNPLSMEVYANGALLIKGDDYTASSGGYNLTVAFDNSNTLLNQQTFARDGAA